MFRDMVTRIFQAMGRRPRFFVIPEALCRLAERLAEKQVDSMSSLTMFLRMRQDLAFDSSEAIRDFEFSPNGFRPELAIRPDAPA